MTILLQSFLFFFSSLW